MEDGIESGKIILLFNSYTLKSKYLHESFVLGDYEVLAIVVEEDDFLPKNVVSVYDLILGNYSNEKIINTGKPRYFNEIEVPDTWSISAGDESGGRITFQHNEKGKIHYAGEAKDLLVKAVDWYDRRGVTRFRDHYNRFGNICARTTYDDEGKPKSKSWFSKEGREILVEIYATDDIILDDGKVMKIFRKKEDLLLYYFKRLGLEQCRIFSNSLSITFFLSNHLVSVSKQDVLFWQDEEKTEISDDMLMILKGKTKRIYNIVVQNKSVYNSLRKLGIGENEIQKLGYIYPFERKNQHRNEVLICTESDRIEHCEELIKALPQMHFHIAALTWMSQKLFDLDRYANVSLYPGVKSQVLNELFATCDYYFDINYRAEIVSAVYRAFLNNQLIFAFRETVHNRDYVADTYIYPISEFERMVKDIQRVMTDINIMNQQLNKQRADAFAETKESYAKILGV